MFRKKEVKNFFYEKINRTSRQRFCSRMEIKILLSSLSLDQIIKFSTFIKGFLITSDF